MGVYATLAELGAVAADYSVPVGSDAQRALETASRDLDSHLLGSGTFDVTLLTAEQVDALREATCIQVCFRALQGPEVMLGEDDGVSAVGPVSFTQREPHRLSPEAAARVAGQGLMRRSGCATPPLASEELLTLRALLAADVRLA